MRERDFERLSTQDTPIKAYVLPLTDESKIQGVRRFSVYVLTEDGLKAVWPTVPDGKASDVPVGMIYSTHASFPAFHFRLAGWGYSKFAEIAQALADWYGNAVELYGMDTHGDPRHIASKTPTQAEDDAEPVRMQGGSLVRRYSLSELQEMPTLKTGHFYDLKVHGRDDVSMVQVWLSRMTIEDGARYDNEVFVERWINGHWVCVKRYPAT